MPKNEVEEIIEDAVETAVENTECPATDEVKEVEEIIEEVKTSKVKGTGKQSSSRPVGVKTKLGVFGAWKHIFEKNETRRPKLYDHEIAAWMRAEFPTKAENPKFGMNVSTSRTNFLNGMFGKPATGSTRREIIKPPKVSVKETDPIVRANRAIKAEILPKPEKITYPSKKKSSSVKGKKK